MKKILFFQAPWCHMCHAMQPKFEAECERLGLIEDQDYEFINADEREELVLEYNVRNLPTQLFLNDNEVMGRESGPTSWEYIKEYM